MASDENIFSNLNPKTLSSVTATDINTTTRDVHIERKNLDALKTTVLVNEATMRDGSPIPGTGQIVTTNVTDNTITSIFPDIGAGEVWAVNVIGAERNGGSGDVVYNLYVSDGTTKFSWFYYKTSDSNPIFTGDANYLDFNIFLDENITLEAKAEGSGGGTYTSVDFYLNVYRVR